MAQNELTEGASMCRGILTSEALAAVAALSALVNLHDGEPDGGDGITDTDWQDARDVVNDCLRSQSAVLTAPYAERDEVAARAGQTGRIEAVVSVDLSEAVDNGLDGWLALLSDRVLGSHEPGLTDVAYNVVGHVGCELLLLVSGDVSDYLAADPD